MAWAGSWQLGREGYSTDRSFGQRSETLDNQRDRPNLRGEDTLTGDGSTEFWVVMTALRRLFGRYAVAVCRPGAVMVLQLVPVGDGVCRFPPGLG